MAELGDREKTWSQKNVSLLIHKDCHEVVRGRKRGMDMDKRRRFEEESTEHLREEGIYWEAEAARLKQTIAVALMRQIEQRGLALTELAANLGTSRAALNRILDPANTSITLTTLTRTAAALGCRVKLEIVVPR